MKKFKSFTNVTEEFIQTFYPEKSVFSKADQQSRRSANLLIGLCVVVLAGMAMLLGIIIRNLTGSFRNDPEMMETGYILLGICGFVCVLCIIGIIFMIKRKCAGRQGLIDKCAKQSGCTQRDIQEFEMQAFSSDALILCDDSILDRILSGELPGILSRQYLMLPGNNIFRIIFKVENIHTICLVERMINVPVNGKIRTNHILSISVAAKNGVVDYVEAEKNFGIRLIELIQERNSAVWTNQMYVMQQKDFDQHVKNIESSS